MAAGSAVFWTGPAASNVDSPHIPVALYRMHHLGCKKRSFSGVVLLDFLALIMDVGLRLDRAMRDPCILQFLASGFRSSDHCLTSEILA
jgi:hypothetical protein